MPLLVHYAVLCFAVPRCLLTCLGRLLLLDHNIYLSGCVAPPHPQRPASSATDVLVQPTSTAMCTEMHCTVLHSVLPVSTVPPVLHRTACTGVLEEGQEWEEVDGPGLTSPTLLSPGEELLRGGSGGSSITHTAAAGYKVGDGRKRKALPSPSPPTSDDGDDDDTEEEEGEEEEGVAANGKGEGDQGVEVGRGKAGVGDGARADVHMADAAADEGGAEVVAGGLGEVGGAKGRGRGKPAAGRGHKGKRGRA